MIGVLFIIFASLSVACGAYIISFTFTAASSSGTLVEAIVSKLPTLLVGLCLNIVGSIFWIYGRKYSINYSFAWLTYLGLLVAFGLIISVLIENEKISTSQLMGIGLLLVSLILLKK
tara:strand:- start:1217 stop:1567 length:351 start_codon:yes stop_codon:yes gene_type:complete